MLTLTIPAIEFYDELNNEFVTTKAQTLQLEHSLVSLSKWEAKWHKPFLTTKEKTQEESIDYIQCMTLTQNVPSDVYTRIGAMQIREVSIYIEAPMTATVLPAKKGSVNRETVTAELIYYWMIALNIPFECQKWHLNRLLTLINVCSNKNQPSSKMGRQELFERNRSLNQQRRQAANSKG